MPSARSRLSISSCVRCSIGPRRACAPTFCSACWPIICNGTCAGASPQRCSPVAKAEPSPAAQRKVARKRTDPAEGEPLPVHSFHTLLGDLATLTRNLVRLGGDRLTAILATPTRTQHRALDLLGVTLTA